MRNQDVHDGLEALRRDAGQALLATVVSIRGSSPGALGSKMLVTPDGRTTGSVGGGCIDGMVHAQLRQVLATGEARVQTVDLTERDDPEHGLICGGRVDVLLQPAPGPEPEVDRAIQRLRDSGQPGLLATAVAWSGLPSAAPGRPGAQLLLEPGGAAVGSLAAHPPLVDALRAELGEALEAEQPRSVSVHLPAPDGGRCPGELTLFVEPLLTTHLVICGSGHIAHALARLAAPLDFRLTVLDDRPAFLNAGRFPGARLLVGEFDHLLASYRAPFGAFVAVVTRGHRYDQECLEWALAQEAPRYVGLIGSRAKIVKILLRARERGFSDEQLSRVRAPIGLDIGAVTVDEIAVSIAAELIAVRRRGIGASRDLREPGRVDPRKARLPAPTRLPPPRVRPT